MSENIKRIVPFDEIITALLDMNRPFPPVFLHRFSNLNPNDLQKVRAVWAEVNPDRRAALTEDLENLADADTLMMFDEIAKFALDDSDPRVRVSAIRLLIECQDPKLAPKFIQILENDPNPAVRAAAATSLGQYIYLGEIEEISQDILHQVEEQLLDSLQSNEDKLVRRRALESLGFSGRPEVKPLIFSAYSSEDPEWLTSAVFAMGRSADQAFSSSVLEMLDHPDPEVQFEAVRAAGELEVNSARGPLLELLESGAENEDLHMAVIWSLSQIGGEGVREMLETLMEETEDGELIDFIEEALDNLYLTEGFSELGMFDFEVRDEDDLDSVTDLDAKQDDQEDEDPLQG